MTYKTRLQTLCEVAGRLPKGLHDNTLAAIKVAIIPLLEMAHELPGILSDLEDRVYSLDKSVEDGDLVVYADLDNHLREHLEYLLDDWCNGLDLPSLTVRMDTLLNTHKGDRGPQGDTGPQGERGPAGVLPTGLIDDCTAISNAANHQLAEARSELDLLIDQRDSFKAEVEEMKELLKDYQEQIADLQEQVADIVEDM